MRFDSFGESQCQISWIDISFSAAGIASWTSVGSFFLTGEHWRNQYFCHGCSWFFRRCFCKLELNQGSGTRRFWNGFNKFHAGLALCFFAKDQSSDFGGEFSALLSR